MTIIGLLLELILKPSDLFQEGWGWGGMRVVFVFQLKATCIIFSKWENLKGSEA